MNQPIELQRDFWDAWNTAFREQKLSDVSLDQKRCVMRWLDRLGRTDLDILKVGCGAGWLCPSLKMYGRVTATDLSTEVLARASARVPDVRFIAGDSWRMQAPRMR
jgi:2-polyprenyl-3-methyl-5-hydroxy-6-metoxy-1,4-benzoquinol methylase